MGIALDNATVSGYGGTTVTWSHTTASGASILLVYASGGTDGLFPSSVTYNAVGLTRVADISRPNASGSLWYLSSPPSGAHNVVITYGSYTDLYGLALSFLGSYVGAPEVYHALYGYGKTISNSLTPLTDNSWVINFLGCGNYSPSFTAGPAWTPRASNTHCFATTSGPISPASAQTEGYTASADVAWDDISCAIKPAASGPSIPVLLCALGEY